MSALHEEPQRQLSDEQRLALELLADAGPHGCTGASFLAYGFKVDVLAGLIRNGLAAAHSDEWPIEVARIMITAAGRTAIED
jgi:hypothetical protein